MDLENVEFDLTNKDTVIELSSLASKKMTLKCFATHEGKNGNGTIFVRSILFDAIPTLIGKSLWVVPDENNFPTVHGYDYQKKEFDAKQRLKIGNITEAYPVMVSPDKEDLVRIYEKSEMDKEEFSSYLLFVVAVIDIDTFYYPRISESIRQLHSIGELFFSVESLTKNIKTLDGKVCIKIEFTGLAAVETPAFKDSISIDISNLHKEEIFLEEVQKRNEELVQENANLTTEKEKVENELNETKVALAEALKNKSDLEMEVSELKPFKEMVEKTEKEKIAKERQEKLKKLGVDVDLSELMEKTQAEFADMALEAVEKFTPVNETDEVDNESEIVVANIHQVKLRKDTVSEMESAIEGLKRIK